MDQSLGDLHHVEASVSCPSNMGWPIRRVRQLTLLVLKSWIHPQLRDAGLACSNGEVSRLLNLQAAFGACALRPRTLKWQDFLVASEEDLEEERESAAARPMVQARWSLVDNGQTTAVTKGGEFVSLYPLDSRASCIAALLPAERRRVEDVLWEESPGVDVLDVSQEPGKRTRRVRKGEEELLTVNRQIGFLLRCDEMRSAPGAASFVCAADVLSLSGVPDYGCASSRCGPSMHLFAAIAPPGADGAHSGAHETTMRERHAHGACWLLHRCMPRPLPSAWAGDKAARSAQASPSIGCWRCWQACRKHVATEEKPAGSNASFR